MKHNNKSNNNKKNKKNKRQTKKRFLKRGGGLFSEMSFGPFVRCQDKPIWNWKTKQNDIQKCYEIFGNKVYKTVQSGTSNDSWFNFL